MVEVGHEGVKFGLRSFKSKKFLDVGSEEVGGHQVDEEERTLCEVVSSKSSVGESLEEGERHEGKTSNGDPLEVVTERTDGDHEEKTDQEGGPHLHGLHPAVESLQLGIVLGSLLALSLVVGHPHFLGQLDLLREDVDFRSQCLVLGLAVDHEVTGHCVRKGLRSANPVVAAESPMMRRESESEIVGAETSMLI